MNITTLLIQAVSGLIGGNLAGAAMRARSLGFFGNSIAGFIGGAVGGQILQAVMQVNPALPVAMNMQSILPHVGGGTVGGAVLMIIIGLIKHSIATSSSADNSPKETAS